MRTVLSAVRSLLPAVETLLLSVQKSSDTDSSSHCLVWRETFCHTTGLAGAS